MNTNKIAAEAATGFLGYPRHNDPNTWDSLYESFLAAIEKATEPLNKALNAIANKSDLLFPAQLRAIASNALQSRAAHASETWWYEITSDSDWIIGSGNRGFALVNDESQAQIIVDRHNRAAHARECICEEGFGMNLSCPVHGAAHASDDYKEHQLRGLSKLAKAAHASETIYHDRLEGLYKQLSPRHPEGGTIEDMIAAECQRADAAHVNEQLIDLIVGDLVRETNIFPNQVERAKELIRERLNEKVS